MDGAPRAAAVSALLVTVGMIAIVYGVLALVDGEYSDPRFWAPLLGGLILLAVFLVLQGRSENPLLPLGFLTSRVRGTAYAGLIALNTSTAGMFFLMVLFLQHTLGYSPLMNGLAWIPFCLVFIFGLQFSMSQMPKLGIRVLMPLGLTVAAIGMAVLATIGAGSTFWWPILPGMVLVAFGGGATFPATQTAAMTDVSMQDAGLGSGIISTVGQIGQALGLAVVATIALKSAAGATGPAGGFGLGLAVAAGFFLLGAVGSFFAIGSANKDVGKIPV